MRIQFTVDLSNDELTAIAEDLFKRQANDRDVRNFLMTAIKDALEDAMVKYEVVKGYPPVSA